MVLLFGSEIVHQQFFVCTDGIDEFLTPADTRLAHRLWHQFQVKRRQIRVVKRLVADILIAAFAARFQGIITRNASDFRNILPTLQIIEP